MKIIAEQKITSVTAGSEDANFPDDNVIDEHPKKIWKASSGVYSTTLTFEIGNGSSGMAIFNTNALSISATVTDPNYVEWDTSDADWFATDASWSAEQASLSDEIYSLDGTSGAAWLEWDYSDISVTAVITLTCSSTDTVYAGVAVADEIHDFACPQMGISEGIHSYSITRELQNGAFYRKERDKVRTFSFNFIEDRTDFYEFMYSIAKELGYRPAAWQLTSQDGFWWVVFARFSRMPSGSHSVPNYTRINTQLIEVL